MLTAFVLSMAVAAPVPAPAPPVATGPAPRLLELKANADGKIQVTITRTEMQKVQVGGGAVAVPPGGAPQPPAVITREVPVQKIVAVDLSEVKDLTITTADGKKVDMADAVAKLKTGGVVVVSADGKPVSPNYLKLFKDDVLVLASPELVAPANQNVPIGRPGGIRPQPPIQIQPLPAPLPPGNAVPLPVKPGVIQIQIQPGQVQVVPLPAPLPAPEPAPEK